MEFKNEAQKQCYEKIGPWLKQIFGEFVNARAEGPVYQVVIGSALTNIEVYPWRENEAVIAVFSWVVTGAETTAELTRDLLRRNLNMVFGGFGIDDKGDIVFKHHIVGSSCDQNELRASVLAVAQTADSVDDELVARYGGQRAVDRRR